MAGPTKLNKAVVGSEPWITDHLTEHTLGGREWREWYADVCGRLTPQLTVTSLRQWAFRIWKQRLPTPSPLLAVTWLLSNGKQQ